MPTKIDIRYSPGKGRGVFATAAIRHGEVIEAAPSLLVPADDRDRLEQSFLHRYLFQTDDGRHYVIATGYVALVNHSDTPNAIFDVTTETATIRALKTIRPGDEICIDYGWTEDEWRG